MLLYVYEMKKRFFLHKKDISGYKGPIEECGLVKPRIDELLARTEVYVKKSWENTWDLVEELSVEINVKNLLVGSIITLTPTMKIKDDMWRDLCDKDEERD